jgi:hypothetical protein
LWKDFPANVSDGEKNNYIEENDLPVFYRHVGGKLGFCSLEYLCRDGKFEKFLQEWERINRVIRSEQNFRNYWHFSILNRSQDPERIPWMGFGKVTRAIRDKRESLIFVVDADGRIQPSSNNKPEE